MLSFVLLLSPAFQSQHDLTFAATTHYVNAKGDIKLRDAPNKDAKTIIWIRNGSEVTVISSSNGWSYVQVVDQKGYVYTSALKKQSPQKSTAPAVTGGLMPKPGLRLTYSDDFVTTGKTTFLIKKNGANSVLFYNTKIKDSTLYFFEDKQGIGFGFTDGNWELFNIDYPIKQDSTVPNNARSNFSPDFDQITIESTTSTVIVEAGTFKNVVILKFPNDIRYYLAKGVGVIRIGYPDGEATELLSIK